jgi:hypothetical protein
MEGAYAAFWSNTQRDPALFPEFYPGIDLDFREEVLRFVDRVVIDEAGTYRDLLTSSRAMVNDRLAPIYGLPGPFTAQWSAVDLDPTQRPGLLTRAGFVGTHGRFGRGSLIFRGAFVLRRILCQEIGSPPAGADATPLPDAPELRTTRERVQAMTSPTTCASCHHNRINPAGFALENFDGIGRYRTEENTAPIDASGTIFLGGEPRAYDGPASYAELLAGSAEAHACYVSRFAQFTFNDHQVDLGCEGEALSRRMAEADFSIQDLYTEFVASDLFRHRSTEEAQ